MAKHKTIKHKKIKKSNKKLGRPKRERHIIVQGKKAALTDKDNRHYVKRFKAKTSYKKDGRIVIELAPDKKFNKKKEELKTRVAAVLGKCLDRTDLMRDILDDVSVESLEKLDLAIKRGAKPSGRPGCYLIKLKDPRKKRAYQIQLRK